MSKKHYDIISIGSMTVDLFIKPKNDHIFTLRSETKSQEMLCFEYGSKLNIEEVHECFGGGASNTSVGFRRLGLHSAVCALIGNDEWGDKALNNLHKEKVDDALVKRTSSIQTSFSVIINSFEGERTVLYYGGANTKLLARHVCTSLQNTDWIFINRLASKEEKIILDEIIKIKKQNSSLRIAWNPGGCQIKSTYTGYKALLKHVDLIIMNKEEAACFSHETYVTPESHEKISLTLPHQKCRIISDALPPYAYNLNKIFKKISKLGPKNIVITDGKRGSQSYDGKYLYFCPILTQDRKDTLGAGDAFSTGFTYAIQQGMGLQMALKFGTINATSVVSFFGAQPGLLTKRQIQELFEQNTLQTIKIHIS